MHQARFKRRNAVGNQQVMEHSVRLGTRDTRLSEQPIVKYSSPCFRVVDAISQSLAQPRRAGNAIGRVAGGDVPAPAVQLDRPWLGDSEMPIIKTFKCG